MVIAVNLGEQSYDIILERGAIGKASTLLNLERKVLVVTDSGVPSEYAEKIASQCKEAYIVTVEKGEKSKSLDNYKMLLEALINNSFTRTDAVCAVGGGVVGDLAGFVSSSYMRGIDFYNIPTTFLSQVDSSIGGKTAIDFMGVKNIVGAFYQPKRVIIDSDVLKTLDKRQLSAGIAESIKMAATFDSELFDILATTDDFDRDADVIIEKSLKIKRDVVENDPKEKNLRKVLNFGHTVGHAIESITGLLHGECVALGMIPMVSNEVKAQLISVLEKYNLPVNVNVSEDELSSYILHDKKMSGEDITVIYCEKIGSYEMRKIKAAEMKKYINGGILK
jgi:3-dehydroquinate synthase